MGNVIVQGVTEKVFFSATNYYGANITASVLDDSANTFLAQDVPMVELVEPITAFTTTTSLAALKGETVITVTDATGIALTDRVDINGEVFRVISKDATLSTITLHRPLEADALAGVNVIKVGNIGVFRIDLFITQAGYFVIQAKDTKFGLHKSDSVTITKESIESMFATTTKEINVNEQILRDTSSYTILI